MSITVVELIMRLGTAMMLGSVIGYERELRERPAGLRTHLLVSLASAAFMLVSAIPFSTELSRYGRGGFPAGRCGTDRLKRRRGDRFSRWRGDLAGLHVEGLTTAASLWLVAAVGMASGAGLYVLAFATAVIALFGLVGLHFVELGFKNVLNLRVRIDTVGEFLSRAQLQEGLGPLGASVRDMDYSCDKSLNRSKIHVDVRLPRHELRREWSGFSRHFRAFRAFACAGRRVIVSAVPFTPPARAARRPGAGA